MSSPPPSKPKQPLPRHFRNDSPPTRRNPTKQLIASLSRLLNEHPPASVPLGGGFYHGPLSIAYLLLILSPYYPDLKIANHHLDTWSARYVQRAQDNIAKFPGPAPSRCGIAEDILCLLAVGAVTGRDKDLAREVCAFADKRQSVVLSEDAGDEWLYGRAGYLWVLRFVRGAFAHSAMKLEEEEARRDDDDDDAGVDEEREKEKKEHAAICRLIDDTADRVVDAIMSSPRPWKWHGKAYLGAVHGMTGILTQVLLTRPDLAPMLEADLGALLSYQYDGDDKERRRANGSDPTSDTRDKGRAADRGSGEGSTGGNWPSSIPPGKDRLVQFCHGAPGIVASLVTLRKIYASVGMHSHRSTNGSNGSSSNHSNKALIKRIDRAIARGRRCIVSRGLLTKEPCLCHGITGNGLALAFMIDDEQHNLHQQEQRRHEQSDESGHAPSSAPSTHNDDEDTWSYAQFEHFLTYTTSHEMRDMKRDGMMDPSDEPAGLYTGEAGRAWAWAVADGAFLGSFPAYNDL